MKFTLNWLKDFLETNSNLSEISKTLTSIGLEVEEIQDQAQKLKDFKVALVKKVEKHPDADRLNLCTVTFGENEFQLVCGAPNVKSNMKAVLAPLGTIIPANGMKIKKAKIRGIESIGMLCSAKELELGEDHEGIIELPDTAEIGNPVAELLGCNDPVIEIAITPNRGDCLGVYGIARDLAAAGIGKLKHPEIPKITESFKSEFQLDASQTKDFYLREIKNIKNTPSPDWLKSRLTAIGLTPISSVVDVTNYIAYCFGQPMHTYDADKIGKNITVRNAKDNEEFLAINEKNYELNSSMQVIADTNEILSLAGIMGGKNSECEETTQNILLEAANFDAVNIANTGRKLQLDSDSRYRFERKIDAAFTKKALDIATNLILEICGGNASEIVSHETNHPVKIINFDLALLDNYASATIDHKIAKNILENLGFQVQENSTKEWKVIIPSFRNDITIPVDLVEEILRINGFDDIPLEEFPNNFLSAENREFNLEMKIRRKLAALGCMEVLTWSFMSSKKAKIFNFAKNSIKLLNPISSDLDVMRLSILPNLLDIAANEKAHGNNNISIFEIGHVFLEIGKEEKSYAILRNGKKSDGSVNNDDANFDIFDVKNDCANIIETFGLEFDKLHIDQNEITDYFHPGRSATLKLGNKIIGYFGEIHPEILKKFKIKTRIVAAEIFPNNLPQTKKKKKFSVNDLQNVERDFAFILDENIPAGDLQKAIFSCDKELINHVIIFDHYQGENIPSGKKSLAFKVVLQPKDKTLTGEEIEVLSNKIIDLALTKFSAHLRDA